MHFCYKLGAILPDVCCHTSTIQIRIIFFRWILHFLKQHDIFRMSVSYATLTNNGHLKPFLSERTFKAFPQWKDKGIISIYCTSTIKNLENMSFEKHERYINIWTHCFSLTFNFHMWPFLHSITTKNTLKCKWLSQWRYSALVHTACEHKQQH